MADIAAAMPAAGARRLLAGGIVATVTIACSVLLGVGVAHADTSLERAARALATERLYVDPEADSPPSRADQKVLRGVLDSAATPIYLAILPESAIAEAGGDPDQLPFRLYQATGERPGTYAVLVGSYLAAGSSVIGAGAGDLASEAAAANDTVVSAVTAFVVAVESEAAQPQYSDQVGPGSIPVDGFADDPFVGQPFNPESSSGPDSAFAGFVVLVVLGAIISVVFGLARAGGRGTSPGGRSHQDPHPDGTTSGLFGGRADDRHGGGAFGAGTLGSGSSSGGSGSFGGGGGTIGGG